MWNNTIIYLDFVFYHKNNFWKKYFISNLWVISISFFKALFWMLKYVSFTSFKFFGMLLMLYNCKKKTDDNSNYDGDLNRKITYKGFSILYNYEYIWLTTLIHIATVSWGINLEWKDSFSSYWKTQLKHLLIKK